MNSIITAAAPNPRAGMKLGASAGFRTAAADVTLRSCRGTAIALWARFEHQIEWGLGRAPKSAEATAGDNYLT